MDVIGKLNDLTNGNLLLWKVILATVVIALAGLQVAMAAGFYEVATLPGISPATATRVHRVSGRLAIDYGVTGQLLFGSDFPMQSTEEALAGFREINNWGPDVRLPKIPEQTIEDIIGNRPLSLLGW